MILIKQHNSQQVAHLYEHLFCMAVDEFFYGHNLFPYLDYELTARVFHGIIYAHFELHTVEAKKLSDELLKLAISLDERVVNTALVQILAEKEHGLVIAGKDTPDWNALRKELRGIEKLPWQHIDEVDVIDPQDIQLVPGSLYAPQDKTSMPARKVKVSFELDVTFAAGHKELLPLFWQLAMLMSEGVTADLYATFGFYSKKVSRLPQHQAVKLVHEFHTPPTYPLELPTVRKAIENTLLDMQDNAAFERLATELRLATHADTDRILPGPHFMFERTNILIGAKGWNRIATDENCQLILSHMKVTASSRRERTSARVNSMLEQGEHS